MGGEVNRGIGQHEQRPIILLVDPFPTLFCCTPIAPFTLRRILGDRLSRLRFLWSHLSRSLGIDYEG